MSRKQIIIRAALCAAVLMFMAVSLLKSPAGYPVHLILTLTAALASAGYIYYLHSSAEKMMSSLSVSTETEFDELKNSSIYNYKNRVYVTDLWLINTFSMKVYPLTDIVRISSSQYSAFRNGTTYCLKIVLSDDTDHFSTKDRTERDKLAGILRKFAAEGSEQLTQDVAVNNYSPKEARAVINNAIKKLREENKRNRH